MDGTRRSGTHPDVVDGTNVDGIREEVVGGGWNHPTEDMTRLTSGYSPALLDPPCLPCKQLHPTDASGLRGAALAAALSLLSLGQPLLLGLTTTLATGAVLLSTQAAYASEIEFKMECGGAGTVTATVKGFDGGMGPFPTDLYSSGLRLKAKDLPGMAGANHFNIKTNEYYFSFYHNDYSFRYLSEQYKCKPL